MPSFGRSKENWGRYNGFPPGFEIANIILCIPVMVIGGIGLADDNYNQGFINDYGYYAGLGYGSPWPVSIVYVAVSAVFFVMSWFNIFCWLNFVPGIPLFPVLSLIVTIIGLAAYIVLLAFSAVYFWASGVAYIGIFLLSFMTANFFAYYSVSIAAIAAKRSMRAPETTEVEVEPSNTAPIPTLPRYRAVKEVEPKPKQPAFEALDGQRDEQLEVMANDHHEWDYGGQSHDGKSSRDV